MRPATKGALFALLGTLILTPDTLLMRLSELDPVAMTGWRGILMGLSLLAVWLLTGAGNGRGLWTGAGIIVATCQVFHVFMFSLGVAVAPVMFVLMGLATVPVISAVLSRLVLQEATNRATWITIALVFSGLMIAILSGHDASADGIRSAFLGTLAGLCVACFMALTFVSFRAAPDLPIALPMGMGALIGGGIAALISGGAALMAGHILPIAITGAVVLPLSFLFLSTATRHVQTATVSLLLLLETILGPFWLWLVLKEPITPGMLMGGALVVLSLAAYLWSNASEKS